MTPISKPYLIKAWQAGRLVASTTHPNKREAGRMLRRLLRTTPHSKGEVRTAGNQLLIQAHREDRNGKPYIVYKEL